MGNELSQGQEGISSISNRKKGDSSSSIPMVQQLPPHIQKEIDQHLEAFKDMQVSKDREIREGNEKITILETELRDKGLEVFELESRLKIIEAENESIKRSVSSSQDSEENIYKGLALLHLSKSSYFAIKNERKENEKLRKRFEELKDRQESQFERGQGRVLSLKEDFENSEKKYRVLSKRNNYNSLQVCGDLTSYLENISKELIPFQDVQNHFLFCQTSSEELEKFNTFVTNHEKVVSLHEDFKREIKKFGSLTTSTDGTNTRLQVNQRSRSRISMLINNDSSDSSDAEDDTDEEEDEGESDDEAEVVEEEEKPLIHQLEIYLKSFQEYCHTQNVFSAKFDSLEERITSIYEEMMKIILTQQDLISNEQVTDFRFTRHLNTVFYSTKVPTITEEYKTLKKTYRSVDEFLSRLSKFENNLKKRFLDVETEIQGLLLLEEEKFRYLKKIEDNFLGDGCPKTSLIPTDLIKEVKKRFDGLFSLIKRSKFQDRIRSNISFNEKHFGTQFSEEKYKNLSNCETWVRLTKLFRSLVSNYLHQEYEKMVSCVDLALENNFISFGKLQGVTSSVKKKNGNDRPKRVTYYGTVKLVSSKKKGIKKDVIPHGIGREYYKKNQVFVGQYENGRRKGIGIDYYSLPNRIGKFEYFAESKFMKYEPLEEGEKERFDIHEFITKETKKIVERKKDLKKLKNDAVVGGVGVTTNNNHHERQPSSVEVAEINKGLKDELEQMKERLECKICYERNYDSILYPCAHTICYECGSKVDHCPFCRAYVDKIVKTYN